MGVSPSCSSNPLTPHACASFSEFSLVGLTDLSSRRWNLGFLPGACLHSVHLPVWACFQSGNNIFTAVFPTFWQKTDQSALLACIMKTGNLWAVCDQSGYCHPVKCHRWQRSSVRSLTQHPYRLLLPNSEEIQNIPLRDQRSHNTPPPPQICSLVDH